MAWNIIHDARHDRFSGTVKYNLWDGPGDLLGACDLGDLGNLGDLGDLGDGALTIGGDHGLHGGRAVRCQGGSQQSEHSWQAHIGGFFPYSLERNHTLPQPSERGVKSIRVLYVVFDFLRTVKYKIINSLT